MKVFTQQLLFTVSSLVNAQHALLVKLPTLTKALSLVVATALLQPVPLQVKFNKQIVLVLARRIVD
jgi:hypothetical protein